MLQSRSSDVRPIGGCVLATRRFSRQEPGPADLVASAVAANFPHAVFVVLRLQSVSTFTTFRFQNAATPFLLLSSKKRRPRLPSLHRRIVIVQKDTFSPEAYMSDLPTIGRRRTSPVMSQDHSSPGGHVQHPQWFSGNNRILAGEKVIRMDPQCFMQGRWLAHHEGRNAVSRGLPAWLLRHRPFSGPPGGTTLAAYLR
jgi:hypothetical protein